MIVAYRSRLGRRRRSILKLVDPRQIPLDTTPEAHAVQTRIYRQLGGAERVAIMFRLSAATRAVTRAGILARHPDYTPDEITLALARLTLGDDLVGKAWPGRPLIDP